MTLYTLSLYQWVLFSSKVRPSSDTDEIVIMNKQTIFLKLQPLGKYTGVDLDERPMNDFY